MKISKYISYILLYGLLSSCDSGDIYPDDEKTDSGIVCYADVSFCRVNPWPTDYNVVIAAYDKDEAYPQVSKGITKPVVGETFSITLPGINPSCELLSITLINKGKRKIMHFATHKVTEEEKEAKSIKFEAKDIDMLAYERVQNQVFSNCTNCHGGSSFAAANLFLTSDKSYSAIVGKKSQKNPQKNIVEPQLPSESFIIDVLENNTEDVKYDHTNVSFNSETEDIELLKEWIKSLK